MELTIRHFIPGRIRLHIPALCRRRSLAEASLAWLRGRNGIRSARINYDCACLVVEYDVTEEALLRAVIGRLRVMSLGDLRNLVAPSQAAGEVPEAAVPSRLDATQSLLRRVPLTLPTLSLALAFSANPVVRAINLPLMLWNAYPIALRAWRVWRREGRLNVDFLDTLAVAASLAQGNPMAGALVTWLIKLGDWIRDLTAAGSRRAIRELLEFQAKTAYVVRDGVVVSIPADELKVGDDVVVYPGAMTRSTATSSAGGR
jgi:cation transport ATPase